MEEMLDIGGYDVLPRFKRTCCLKCIHFQGTIKGTCKAYPNGIPDKFAMRNPHDWMNMHNVIESDQEGSFVFTSL